MNTLLNWVQKLLELVGLYSPKKVVPQPLASEVATLPVVDTTELTTLKSAEEVPNVTKEVKEKPAPKKRGRKKKIK